VAVLLPTVALARPNFHVRRVGDGLVVLVTSKKLLCKVSPGVTFVEGKNLPEPTVETELFGSQWRLTYRDFFASKKLNAAETETFTESLEREMERWLDEGLDERPVNVPARPTADELNRLGRKYQRKQGILDAANGADGYHALCELEIAKAELRRAEAEDALHGQLAETEVRTKQPATGLQKWQLVVGLNAIGTRERRFVDVWRARQARNAAMMAQQGSK
jgi:hypothetical protein